MNCYAGVFNEKNNDNNVNNTEKIILVFNNNTYEINKLTSLNTNFRSIIKHFF